METFEAIYEGFHLAIIKYNNKYVTTAIGRILEIIHGQNSKYVTGL